ncbi:4-alpha-glucanotransferase [Micrococcales bacterium 31B]|nr:4-alpha-glucanotransferase [Micrococcales bacterium 31B]
MSGESTASDGIFESDAVSPPLPSVDRDPLVRLAQSYGITCENTTPDAGVVAVPSSTLQLILESFGVDASSDESVARALEDFSDAPWLRVLPAPLTLREGQELPFHVYVPHDSAAGVTATLSLEDGKTREFAPTLGNDLPKRVHGRDVTRLEFVLPADLPAGYHELSTSASDDSTAVIVAPQRIEYQVDLERQPAWGFSGLLYALRSKLSWGLGDFSDVAELGHSAGSHFGADFLMLAPIHASETRPPFSVSPFRASSRRWINPMYVRVEDIHETAYVRPENRSLIDWHSDDSRTLNKISEVIDRDRAWGSKLSSLNFVYQVPRSPSREAQFERFIEEGGDDLHNFAVYSVLRAEIGIGDTRWKTEARDPSAPLSQEVAEQRVRDVRFHMWLQWVADQQLANAQRVCREAGMRIGLLREIVPGVTIYGADAWCDQHVYASGMRQGSPVSVIADEDGGWVWDQPVFDPRALREAAYAPFQHMIRSHMRHAGAVRVSRALDLFKQWWVPDDVDPSEGTWVHYDHEAMFNIIVLEAHRAGALVIADSDGMDEPWMRDYLRERGVLITAMLWSESDAEGNAVHPRDYHKQTFATLTAHDLPALAGYLGGELVDVRNRLGLIKTSFAEERLEDIRVRQPYIRMAREGKFVAEEATERQVIEGLHRFVAASPALLVSVSIADAVGERRAPYVAGSLDSYPNWKLPLADSTGDSVTVDSIPTHPRLESLARAIARVRGRFAPPSA